MGNDERFVAVFFSGIYPNNGQADTPAMTFIKGCMNLFTVLIVKGSSIQNFYCKFAIEKR